jgi:hypothetical protein
MAITKMSNLGIASLGSEKYNDMLAGNPPFIPTSFDSIATYTATGSETSFTFSSIPQTYKYLQVRTMARATGSFAGSDNLRLSFNGDAGTNYNNHTVYGYWNGSANAMDYFSNASGLNYIILTNTILGGGITANYFAQGVTDIYDYTNTSKVKVASNYYIGSADSNASTMGRTTGLWNNTAAITSLTVACGTAMASGSVISLYGIEG